MTIIDTLSLWVGYCVCALALVRVLIDSIFATHRCFRRALRWMSKAWPLHVITAMTFDERKAEELRKPLP